MHDLRVRPLLAVLAALPHPACDDTAVVLEVTTDRKVPTEMDGFCLEVDSGGAPRFQRRVQAMTFPQTLTVLPGGGDDFSAQVTALKQGLALDDWTLRIGFLSHQIRDVPMPVDRCPPSASSGQLAQVAAQPLSSGTAVVVATARGPRVLVFQPGSVQSLTFTGGALVTADATLPPAPAGNVTAIAVADLDGDCDSDLVMTFDSGPPAVWRHDGAGRFTEVMGALPLDVAARGLAVADFDGDGKVDLAAVGPGARLFHGDGTGLFMEVQNGFVPPPMDATCVAAGDLDGMGGADLAVGQGGTQPAMVYLNDSGVLRGAPGALPPVALNATGVAMVDLDGDGDRDVVFASAMGVKLYLNRGNGLLEDGSFGRVPGMVAATGVVAVDVDRDCQPDLVLTVADEPPVIWFGKGGGALQGGTVDGLAGVATSAFVGDIDGNGSRDVVLPGAGAVWIQK